MLTSIIFLFLAVVGISFLCSLSEAVILSVNSSYVTLLVREKRKSGILLEHLLEKIDRPISAILTLNTLANTLGSAVLAYRVNEMSDETGVTIMSFILTFAILVFAEIIPKSIGARYWKILAPAVAYYTQFLILILYPAVVLSEKMHRLFPEDRSGPEVTREEMIINAELGVEEGTIKNKESLIIKNLLMLDKIYVSDIMTPRSVFFALDAELTADEVVDKHKPIRFSRVPVYQENLDHIIGMTHRYKILEAVSQDELTKKIGEMVTPIASLPEKMTVSHALDFFIKEKEHVALAIDEYGVVSGLVSLEDAVETLLGVEIVDEFDNVEDMRKFALEQWHMRKQKTRRS